MNGMGRMFGGDTSDFRAMRGIVVDNADPLKLGRVRVRVYSKHSTHENGIPDQNLEWAFVCQPWASYNSGSFIVPEVGATVLLIYENGDSSKPVVVGSIYGKGKSKVDYVGNTGKRLRYRRAKTDDRPPEIDDLDLKLVYKSPKGHKIVMCDEDEHEYVKVTDAMGQVFVMGESIDSEYSENGAHLENTDMTKSSFSAFEGIKGRAVMMWRSLTNSFIRVLSGENDSEISITAKGEKSSQIVLKAGSKAGIIIRVEGEDNCEIDLTNGISVKRGSSIFEVQDKRVVIKSDEIIVSTKDMVIDADRITTVAKDLQVGSEETKTFTKETNHFSNPNILIDKVKEVINTVESISEDRSSEEFL